MTIGQRHYLVYWRSDAEVVEQTLRLLVTCTSGAEEWRVPVTCEILPQPQAFSL
jgi:hypothetical protein